MMVPLSVKAHPSSHDFNLRLGTTFEIPNKLTFMAGKAGPGWIKQAHVISLPASLIDTSFASTDFPATVSSEGKHFFQVLQTL
jgi:hypothetical protein